MWPKVLDSKTVFFLSLIAAGSGVVSPPVALIAGVVFGLAVTHPYRAETSSLAKFLLQCSVVALGFGMNIHAIARAGSSGLLYTAGSITLSLAAGWLIGSSARVRRKCSLLISVGTAICGCSAIAAVAPVIHADEEEISVSLGTIFLLNSVALLIFPAIGFALHLTQNQFGLWAALAIHDTSSVVGAAAKFGDQALAVGTTIKLARALWIIPVSLAAAFAHSRSSRHSKQVRAKITLPWFILYFCVASALSTWLPQFAPQYAMLSRLGRAGLTATLFLIGTQLSRETFRRVGARPLVQGLTLWIIVASASLLLIYRNIIHV